MKQVQMTLEEFAVIAKKLATNPSAEISIQPEGPFEGELSGVHEGRKWSADYSYLTGTLHINGHGMWPIGGKVESGIVAQLNTTLLELRANPA